MEFGAKGFQITGLEFWSLVSHSFIHSFIPRKHFTAHQAAWEHSKGARGRRACVFQHRKTCNGPRVPTSSSHGVHRYMQTSGNLAVQTFLGNGVVRAPPATGCSPSTSARCHRWAGTRSAPALVPAPGLDVRFPGGRETDATPRFSSTARARF